MSILVEIQCYAPYSHNLKQAIESRLKDLANLEVKEIRDRGVTGNFKVRVSINGGEKVLIHDKGAPGQMRCETPEEVDAVINKIITMQAGAK